MPEDYETINQNNQKPETGILAAAGLTLIVMAKKSNESEFFALGLFLLLLSFFSDPNRITRAAIALFKLLVGSENPDVNNQQ